MSEPGTLVMGTRGSALALAQSRLFASELQAVHPGLLVQERVIRTTGDRQQGAPLPAIGGKGVFTLEIERALLHGEIDFAVHSLKDLPPELPDGLCLGCIPRRASANDVCVLNSQHRNSNGLMKSATLPLPFLPHGARVGTSSLRRRAQLLHLRPDLLVENVRGNIDTRLRKLEEQSFDAIVLARAGLERLGLVKQLSTAVVELDKNTFVPAPGQGALAIEVCADNEELLKLLQPLECASTRAAIAAERSAMRALQAGCTTPLGAHAVVADERFSLRAVVLSLDGRQRLEAQASGTCEDAAEVGEKVAANLLEQGARELFES